MPGWPLASAQLHRVAPRCIVRFQHSQPGASRKLWMLFQAARACRVSPCILHLARALALNSSASSVELAVLFPATECGSEETSRAAHPSDRYQPRFWYHQPSSAGGVKVIGSPASAVWKVYASVERTNRIARGRDSTIHTQSPREPSAPCLRL